MKQNKSKFAVLKSVTPVGRLIRSVLAAVAEYEREDRSEQIRAGVAKAKAAGKRWGGSKLEVRRKLTPKMLKSIAALLRAGVPKTEIARQLKINRSTVYETMKLIPPGA